MSETLYKAETPKDTLDKKAFDNNETTSVNIPKKTRGFFMYVDESAIGKKITITGSQSRDLWMYVIDNNGSETVVKTIEGYVIPENIVKIEIYNPISVGRNLTEIGIKE